MAASTVITVAGCLHNHAREESYGMYKKRRPLVTALYLPQYYETEYNNQWWGKGYTEWYALKRAKPLYPGHNQPRVPLKGNYYDLSKKENIRWQMQTAREYGIDGFAIYQYYSCGEKLLEVPTEMIRDDPSLDLPFFLFWANESWRKAWFGQDSTIVWEQKYGQESDWRAHFDYCLPYFKDERYIKIDGKPVYAIYNPRALPDQDRFMDAWDRWAKEAGLPGVYFVKKIGYRDSEERGRYSAIVMREPGYTIVHNEPFLRRAFCAVKERGILFINNYILKKTGRGIVRTKLSYDRLWNRIISAEYEDKNVILGCFCDWDNSPRKGFNSLVTQGVTTEKFKTYFSLLFDKACKIGSPMIIINAWNEWAEGAYLEPDEKNGYGFLEAIRETKRSRGIEV